MGERLDTGRDAQKNVSDAGPQQAGGLEVQGGPSGASARGQSAEMVAASGGGAEINAAAPPGGPPGEAPAEGLPDFSALHALAAKAVAQGLPLVSEVDPATGRPTWRLKNDIGPRWNDFNFGEQIQAIVACGAEYTEPAQLDAVVNQYFEWVAKNYPIYPEQHLAAHPTAKAIHRSDGDPNELMKAMGMAAENTEGAIRLGNGMGWFMVAMSATNIFGLLVQRGLVGICGAFDVADLALGVGAGVAGEFTDGVLVKYGPGELGPFQLAWFLNYVVGHTHHIDRFFAEACPSASPGVQAAARQTIVALVQRQ